MLIVIKRRRRNSHFIKATCFNDEAVSKLTKQLFHLAPGINESNIIF